MRKMRRLWAHPLLEIRARAEGATLSREDQDTGSRVLVHPRQRVGQRKAHLGVERVKRLRPAKRQREDALGVL